MRVFVKSFGCSTNVADGEMMAGCLAKAGHELVSSVSEAEFVVCNSCAVKGPTENRVIDFLERVPKSKKLIVAGCLPLISSERLHATVRFDAIVGPALGNEIVNIANRVADGEKIIALENALEAKPSLDLPRLRLNPVISIVPVSYGCLGSCAYCCVVFARGRLRSYSREEIVNRVRKDLASGAKEVWITAQDTASYGLDKKTSLAELLGNLCKIEGDFKVRVGMMTPNIALSILKELVRSFRDEHVFKFLHLPVQSGDDKVLERMHRSYSVDDFRKIVDAFRGEFPSLTLSTDIICGFPGESEEAFDRTLGLIEGVRPDVVNVSKFFARPRTLALEMKEEFVPYHEVKRRSARAAALVKRVSLEKNREWTDWTGEILVDEKGKIPDSWIGRNFAYKPVVAKSQDYLLGKQMRVKVSKVFSTYLESEIIG